MSIAIHTGIFNYTCLRHSKNPSDSLGKYLIKKEKKFNLETKSYYLDIANILAKRIISLITIPSVPKGHKTVILGHACQWKRDALGWNDE